MATLHTSLPLLSIPIYGMNCVGCAGKLQSALNEIEGISSEVNFALEKAQISFKENHDHSKTLSTIITLLDKKNYQTDRQALIFDVVGWSCVSCANKTVAALSKHPFTFNVQSNFATETVQLQTLQGAFTKMQLDELLASLSYQLTEKTQQNFQTQQATKLTNQKKRDKKVLTLLAISTLLSLPFILSMLVMFITGSHHFLPRGLEFLLATPVQFIIGARFYKGAWNSLKDKSANMDLLVALGTSAAYFYSLYILITGLDQPLYFESSTLVITLVTLGKYLEHRAKQSTSSAINALMALRPDTAFVKKGKIFVSVNIDEVQQGDIVQLAIGEKAPVDGIIIEGTSYLDESLLTGESKPLLKEPQSTVIAGSINGEGVLLIKTTAVGESTSLSKIIHLVENAQMSKAPIMQLVDKISAIFVPIVLVIAALTFSIWYFTTGDFQQALINAVAVLVIACPCALGLATPTAVVVGTGVAAQQGILIKDIKTLQQVFRLQTIIFDKTGTLTEGKGSITHCYSVDNNDELMLAQLAGLQMGSKHPIAKTIKDYCSEKQIEVIAASDISAVNGEGIQGIVISKEKATSEILIAGNQQMMARFSISIPKKLDLPNEQTIVYIAKSGQFWGVISISDKLREMSQDAISELKQRGLQTIMLSGDKHSVVQYIAQKLHIDEYHSELKPEQKLNKLIELQKNSQVAMVGDGVNDAPALAQADISIAMGTGSDAAKETASITLMRNDPRLVAIAIDISKATWHKIQQNLFLAFIFNTVAIPAAAMGYLSPAIAGAAMALSSITVLTNSLLLKRLKIKELS
ncbi:heavy metal translocating P-type ATPase [Psychromonas hadalis]|uniref:heavy metal translocating P-type ATPase n=1 Tax=Psychromonas hadalis TaxID=211669 RepID=UPI0003B5DBBE|nr:heavy metal translocating P-type ATPase [Psychromonas hadalis]